MNYILKGLLTTIFVTASLVQMNQAFAEPIGNLMYCRPGNNFKLYYMQTHTNHAVTILYKKSFSDHLSDLQPGQCTWAERQMDYSEPLVARFDGSHGSGYAAEFEVGAQKMRLNSTNKMSYKTKYLIENVNKGRIIRFCGYARNQGGFTINGFQYTRYIKITRAGKNAKCQ
jgi:hypothetical protein